MNDNTPGSRMVKALSMGHSGKIIVDGRRAAVGWLLAVVWAVIVMGFGLPASAQSVAAGPARFTAAAQKDLPPNTELIPNLVYATPGGLPQKLDLYLPKDIKMSMPLVVFIHGGSWSMGDKKDPLGFALLRQGFALASIDYRLSGTARFPAQLYDCKAAIRWLRANAAQYRIDPREIGVWGVSAGAHLGNLLGTTGQHPELEGNEGNPGVSSAVQAVCSFSGPANFVAVSGESHKPRGNAVAQLLGGSAADNPAKARAASPIFYVAASDPPFLLVHGDKDSSVPLQQSIEFYNALKQVGDDVNLDVVRGGGHVPLNPVTRQRAVDFFKEHLQK